MMKKIKTSKTEMHQLFNALIAQLVQAYAPLQIYQFARLTKQEQVDSLFCNAPPQTQRIYYLLMVTEGSEITESDVQDFADRSFTAAKLIFHVLKQSPSKNLQRRLLRRASLAMTRCVRIVIAS